jgi:hypothetical protein|tara:strand:+ start:467 stop:1252 length:786 start_codon:yes stop_codon:yes gene_type:complete
MADKTGYIGRNPGDGNVTVARQSYTASGITTDFTFSSGYTPGYFDVYINGVKMIEGSDYTSSDGSTFSILNGGAADGDSLEAVAFKAFSVGNVNNASSDFNVGGNLSVTGTSTLTGNTTVGSAITLSSSTALVGSAITLTASTGIVSATAFYGDGSNLSNIISGVGINSGGTNIGYGVTTLNFVGSGTTIEVSGTTANISAGGGGGAIGTTGITTQTIFSNPNTISEDQMLTVPGSNYGVFGPVSVGAAVTVGAGNTFVIV